MTVWGLKQRVGSLLSRRVGYPLLCRRLGSLLSRRVGSLLHRRQCEAMAAHLTCCWLLGLNLLRHYHHKKCANTEQPLHAYPFSHLTAARDTVRCCFTEGASCSQLSALPYRLLHGYFCPLRDAMHVHVIFYTHLYY